MLRGVEEADGLCLVKKELRNHMNFYVDNILTPKKKDKFDVIFGQSFHGRLEFSLSIDRRFSSESKK